MRRLNFQAVVSIPQSEMPCMFVCGPCHQVDKAKFAENEFDREMLLGKTFAQGSAQAGVRADR